MFDSGKKSTCVFSYIEYKRLFSTVINKENNYLGRPELQFLRIVSANMEWIVKNIKKIKKYSFYFS